MSQENPKNFNFETALEELNGIVEKMEKGELSLENSLSSFQRGTELIQACQKTLQEAEQKVQILTTQGEKAPFQNDNSDN